MAKKKQYIEDDDYPYEDEVDPQLELEEELDEEDIDDVVFEEEYEEEDYDVYDGIDDYINEDDEESYE